MAGCVKRIKGASAHAINLMPESDQQSKWQEGYGALTISEIALETVMAYAANQKLHHQDRTFQAFYEKVDEGKR
ncbi:hypothetical protein HGB07_03815 [Candidatus Roizmanbacteria bacterium]|nr:hypothetical protein [Candidatus Roizmanbacteria bacterium]